MIKEFKCHTIAGGEQVVEGKALVSPESVCFYMVDFKTGVVKEEGHALDGVSLKDVILVIPSGKGSSVVQDEGLFGMQQNNAGPKAIIVKTPDTVLVAGCIVFDYPLLDRLDDDFNKLVKDGDQIKVDCKAGTITVN
jgi:uncharacterized protein